MVEITLELPELLAAELEQIRKEFGEELVADLIQKAHAAIVSKLALRGILIHK